MHFHLLHALHHLAPSFGHATDLTYWIAFLAALFESFAFVGTFVPGSTLIILAGFAASRGVVDVGDLIWFVILGAVLGDGMSYYLGTKGSRFFKENNRILKASYLRKGEAFFRRHGSKSVFLGRFIAPVRAIVPFVAGTSRMDIKVFLFWNVASAVLWAFVHVLLGYFFGSAFRTIEHWISRTGAILTAFLLLGFLLWHYISRARAESAVDL